MDCRPFDALVAAAALLTCTMAAPGCADTEACSALAALYDFESGDQGFIHTRTNTDFEDPWALGTPADETCHTGQSCWATDLDGEYGNCEAGGLFSPTLDLSPCAGTGQLVRLMFWHVYRLEDDYDGTWYDGALVQLSGDDGGSWNDVSPTPGYTGTIEGNYSECSGTPQVDGHEAWSGDIPDNTWRQVAIDLDDTLRTDAFRARFQFGTDRGEVDEGWYIDDVEIRVE